MVGVVDNEEIPEFKTGKDLDIGPPPFWRLFRGRRLERDGRALLLPAENLADAC